MILASGVYSDQTYAGQVIVNSPDVRLERCRFAAGPTIPDDRGSHLILGTQAKNVTLSRCEFDGSAFRAITSRGRDITIEGCTIRGSAANDPDSDQSFYSDGVKVSQAAGLVLIQGCTILDVGGMGVLFTAATVPGDRLVVSGCTIRGCGQAGVSAYKTRAASGWGGYGLVENCLISECNRLAGTPGALGNAACGLHLNDGRRTETDPAHPFILWTFKGNRITGCAAALSPKNEDSGGIAVDFNAHGASIIENVIVGNWGKGGYALNANSTQWIRNVFVGNDSGLVVSSEGGAESCLNTVIRENIFLYNWNGADRGPGYDAEIAHMNVEGLTIARNRYLAARTWIRQIGDGSRAVVEKDNADLSEAPVADPISVDGVVMRGNAVIGRLAMVSPEVGGQMAPS